MYQYSSYRQEISGEAVRKKRPKRSGFNYPRRGYGPVHRWLPSWRFLLGATLFPIGVGGGLFYGAWYTTHVPDNLDSVNSQITTIYYNDAVALPDGTVQGTPIGTLAKERRIIVDYADLPSYVGNAVVASEDQTFWTNPGVDFKGIARALYNNLRGGQRQGASTLTQQYVERYYTDTVSDYVGKAKEAIMALKVSDEQPKEQILNGYLNTIYWGRGAYGIEAASQMYFGHPAAELSISESAMLAGIIPSPSRWDPAKDELTARNRFNRTISMMLQGGFITEAEAAAASFPAYLPPPKLTGSNDGQNGYLINEVVRELTRSGPFADNPEQITTLGLNIITTIDKDLQAEAARIGDCLHPENAIGPVSENETPDDAAQSAAYAESQVKFCKDLLGSPDKAASPTLQIGLVSINPQNGEIVTLYGGQNYAQVQFNFATDGRAQGGSTFKPFTLIAALERGHKLNEIYNGNSGIDIPGWQSAKNLRNYGNVSYGDIDLIKATANSVNTVFAKLNIDIGPDHTTDVAHALGIPDVTDPNSAGFIADNPANVLGTASVRPIDLAHAYATIAADGYETTPHLVREVHNLRGTVLYEGPTEQLLRVDPLVIDATTYAMEQVVKSGSGKSALAVKGPKGEFRPIAGKTGSANDNIAAWFAGFTPQLVTVVGLHQDTPDGLGEEPITPFGRWKEITGSTFPVTAWAEFMKVALADQPVVPFPEFTPPPPALPPGCYKNELDELVCIRDGEDGYWIGEEWFPNNPEPTPTPSLPPIDYVKVPSNLTGRTSGEAVAALSALGLTADVRSQVSAEVAPGLVVSVSSAGQSVPPGSIIVVMVAQAPPAPPAPPAPTPGPTATPTPTEPPSVIPPTVDPIEPPSPGAPDGAPTVKSLVYHRSFGRKNIQISQ